MKEMAPLVTCNRLRQFSSGAASDYSEQQIKLLHIFSFISNPFFLLSLGVLVKTSNLSLNRA